MTSLDRRRFLRLASAAAGGAWAAQALPAGLQRALQIPADRRSGSIEDVDHVVILMQENRSFDHYFGSLRGVRGFNDPRPLIFPSGESVWHQPNARVRTAAFKARGVPADAPSVLPFHIDTQLSGDHQDGTDHSWSSGHLAWNYGRWDQWVTQKQDALTMGYVRRQDLAFHYALADAFTVCDSYFSSSHADTAINRIYLWSGTADPRNVMGRKSNGPGLAERAKVNGYTWTTYPERLQQAGVSWKLYQGGTGDPGDATDNYTDNSLEFFAAYQVAEGADPHGPLVRNGASQHTLRELRQDVLDNRLPQVSWIVAPFKYCEHPDAAAVDGAGYIARVLDALTANPASWGRTVLLVNYDENDGLFDHVVPPMPPLSSQRNAQGMVSPTLRDSLQDEILDLDVYTSMQHPLVPGAEPGGRQPIGLGVRVPMLVVSPWSTGGWVCSQTFDHTSVLQFLEARFGVAEPNISAWRRAVCGDLTSAFDFSRRPDGAVPALKVPAHHQGDIVAVTAPAVPTMPMQEPGLRPSRPVPYAWTVDHRVQPEGPWSWLQFHNSGYAGAAFYVYDQLAPQSDPRRYTVAAGDTLADCWPLRAADGGYDATVRGPHGYLCHVRGDAQQPPLQVRLRYDVSARELLLSVTNAGFDACAIRIANAYVAGASLSQPLPPGVTRESRWPVAASHGWYDLSVTAAGASTLLHRYAGRLENGAPGFSDPGPVV